MADRLRLFLRLLGPEAAAAAEAESRAWLLVCPHCGLTRSVWEMGGIRYRASGATSRRLLHCPKCGQTGWHRVVKGPNFPTQRAPVWPVFRLVIGLLLAIWFAVAGIVLIILTLTRLV